MLMLLSLLISVAVTQLPVAAQIRHPTMSGTPLYDAVIGKYNKYILPVETTDNNVNILLLLRLVQLTDIDEKNQIMTSTVWIRHEWHDANLVWSPSVYNNITKMHLPSDDLWLPDTVLYNNADGDYQITTKTKVTVYNDGRIIWIPPAIYKSFCAIDVKFFPFDEQVCELKFGPWSYDISKVDFWLYFTNDNINYNTTNFLSNAADMTEYSESGEWDILQITGKRTVWRYPCCPEEYVDITYRIHLRRKTLYYTVNLIVPVLLISLLTVFIFYLPSQSGEKITLSSSILVSMVFFILMLYEMIPPTSLDLPLMSKYLLFTIVLVTLSTIVSIFTLTIHFRHAHAYDMHPWIRRLFLMFLPRLLFYESPALKHKKWYEEYNDTSSSVASLPHFLEDQNESIDLYQSIPARKSSSSDISDRNNNDYDLDSLSSAIQMKKTAVYENLVCDDDENVRKMVTQSEVKQALRDVRFISMTFRQGAEEEQKEGDWEAVAGVMDRLFLLIFTAAVVIGTGSILASAPSLYDATPPIA